MDLNLLENAVDAKTTGKIYDRALRLWASWLDKGEYPPSAELALSPQTFDTLLAEYLQHLWSSHASKGLASSSCSAVQHAHPSLKHQLHCSWRTVSSWAFLEPSTMRGAWPVDLALAVARCLNHANHRGAALSVLTSFHCFFRPGEASKLLVKDFLGAESIPGVLAPLGLFAIHGHKTQRRSARVHHVLIENQVLLEELTLYIKASIAIPNRADSPLFPSYASPQRVVKKVLAFLLGEDQGFTLAGLRGGGATQHYFVHRNVPDLLRRGRWASAKSLEHYLQYSCAFLTGNEWSPQIAAKVRRLAVPWRPLLV